MRIGQSIAYGIGKLILPDKVDVGDVFKGTIGIQGKGAIGRPCNQIHIQGITVGIRIIIEQSRWLNGQGIQLTQGRI